MIELAQRNKENTGRGKEVDERCFSEDQTGRYSDSASQHYIYTFYRPKNPFYLPCAEISGLQHIFACMLIFGKKISSDTLSKWIFHILLWSVWIGLPIINSPEDSKFREFNMRIIPVALTNIPLFLINSEWLIPHIFRKRGLPVYLLALLSLIAVYAAFQMFFKEMIIPDYLMRRHWDLFWAFIPVLFVTAISTGYGFIIYLLNQEKTRQEEQRERLQSELSFLRSQISPHFIFNILNSIVYLIRSNSPQAERTTIKLSELMRYMLYESGVPQVPLEKEVEYLINYVELQKTRFEEDVDIRLHVEGNAGAHVIEPMLLIPFVENAFKHGVGLIRDPFIDIDLKIGDNGIHFLVKNKVSPEKEDKDNASGIGLKNVTRRLELLYPGKHFLSIQESDLTFTAELQLSLTGQHTSK